MIACDSPNSWRKDFFPNYKYKRNDDRDSSDIDWKAVFAHFQTLKDEIKESFPWITIQVPKLEADDIIAILCRAFGNSSTRILILSGDKDFSQLQKYKNVTQYDPTRKRWIVEVNPVENLKRHIIKGDAIDGIPNILSPDDCFVQRIRQSPIREEKLSEWVKMEPKQFCTESMLRNWERNRQLIDLEKLDVSYDQIVLDSYKSQINKPRNNMYGYFVKHKLINLLDSISEF